MKAQMLVLAGCLALAPLAFAQDHAVPRGGGDGGGSSGGGHPSAGGGGSVSSSSSGGSSSSSGGSSYSSGSSGSSSMAERRHPRAGTSGSASHGGGGYYPGWGGGYYPGYGYGYGSYWWPYGAYGWYGGYWGWGGMSVDHYVHAPTGSVRVLVDPPEARVYVDGYYAGVVDDFDGLFQRLNTAPGRHEITLKLEGYKSYRVKVYVSPDSTLKLRYDLQKGTGETFEDLAGREPERELRRTQEADEGPWEVRERPRSEDPAASGRLKLTVRPADASVYVDGAFRGTGREAASLALPPGRHRIEVVRPGYQTVEKEIEVVPGEPAEMTIDLEKGTI
jgi:hypothetical protein